MLPSKAIVGELPGYQVATVNYMIINHSSVLKLEFVKRDLTKIKLMANAISFTEYGQQSILEQNSEQLQYSRFLKRNT